MADGARVYGSECCDKPCCAGFSVATTETLWKYLFTGPLVCSGVDVEEWEWDFGDGATSTEQEPSHQYENAGEFTVRLTTTMENGETCFTEQVVLNVCEAADGLAVAEWIENNNARVRLTIPSNSIVDTCVNGDCDAVAGVYYVPFAFRSGAYCKFQDFFAGVTFCDITWTVRVEVRVYTDSGQIQAYVSGGGTFVSMSLYYQRFGAFSCEELVLEGFDVPGRNPDAGQPKCSTRNGTGDPAEVIVTL